MDRRRLLFIIGFIAFLSIALNFILLSIHRHFLDEEQRLKESSWTLQSVNYPNYDFYKNLERISELPAFKKDSIVLTSSRTIKNLITIMGEMVNNSGGIDPGTFHYVNPYATKQVRNYFYESNSFRNNAIDFYNETIDQYLRICIKHKVSGSLIRNLHARNETSENMLFESMTLVESISFLDNLCYIITIEANNHIINKTFANNGEHS